MEVARKTDVELMPEIVVSLSVRKRFSITQPRYSTYCSFYTFCTCPPKLSL